VRHVASIAILLALTCLMAAAAAAQTQEFRFHWAPSPALDEQGSALPEAVGYQVWLRRDADDPEQIAVVEGDTIYTLDAEPGVVQRVCVRAYAADGALSEFSDWSDPIYFEVEVRGESAVPPAGSLAGNYPNPFNPETRIRYGIPEGLDGSARASLEVYGIDGRRVRTFEVDRTAGWHEVTWDGTDDRGVVQATGMYVTRLVVGDRVQTAKMTMLK
jgi:hypothetical protein